MHLNKDLGLFAKGAGFRLCVYGGQFGSEGKGCVAEYLIAQYHDVSRAMVVFGENSPNSGHTNTKGKTRSLPVSAYFADAVFLGPDAAIDPNLLDREIREITTKRNGFWPGVYVHENAAIITQNEVEQERSSSLVSRVASTVTGGGAARTSKALYRSRGNTMDTVRGAYSTFHVTTRKEWFELIASYKAADWLFECSQGLMLDLNLGYFPHVTSRTTNPRAAIERNGLGPSSDWSFVCTYRTYPIRTGGNSGPTGGEELQWQDLGVAPEIATVTRRTRRIFKFSGSDFLLSLNLIRPKAVAFTHLDYLAEEDRSEMGFKAWLEEATGLYSLLGHHPALLGVPFFTSAAPAMFNYIGSLELEDLA